MAKIVLDTVVGGYDLSIINSNFDKIESDLNGKVLYRDNPIGEANQLETDVDANHKRIYNLPTPILNSEATTKGYVDALAFGGGGGESGGTLHASAIEVTPVGDVSAIDVQSAIEELDLEKASISYVQSLVFPTSVWAADGFGNVYRDTGKVYIDTDTDLDYKVFGVTPATATLGLQAAKGGFFRKMPETATDAADTALAVYRQADFAGGTPGFVNSAAYINTVTGAANTSFEWNLLTRLDNFSAAGDNVSHYMLAWKNADGPTFGAVIDAREANAPSGGGLIGLELDLYTVGVKNNAVGIDVYHRHSTGGGGATEAGFGIRVQGGATNKWQTGFYLSHAKNIGIHVDGVSTSVGISITGTNAVGIDVSGSTLTDAALRLASSQFIAFEGTSQRRMSYKFFNATMGNSLSYAIGPNAGDLRWGVNDSGTVEQLGVLRIAGNQVLGARRSWSGAWTNTDNTWRTSAFNLATVTDAFINSNTVATSVRPLWNILGCLIEDLKAHGVIG